MVGKLNPEPLCDRWGNFCWPEKVRWIFPEIILTFFEFFVLKKILFAIIFTKGKYTGYLKTFSGVHPAAGATPDAMTTYYGFVSNMDLLDVRINPVIEAAAGRRQ
jgi:hypothetical protein